MLLPKRVKHRKQHRGRMTGVATRGNKVTYGEFGLMTTEPAWITAAQIEAARIAMTRYTKRGGKVWINLVMVAPVAKPPVCKIIDYGKYKYEMARKEKEARKKQKTIDVKEVRLSPNIEANDIKTKAAAARKFITKGDKVKVTLRFRGREIAHMHASKHVLEDFAELLSDIAVVEKGFKVEGRSMIMFLSEKK